MFPPVILKEIAWSFTNTTYNSVDQFNEEVKQYQLDIFQEDRWQPENVVLNSPRFLMEYEFWTDEGDEQVETVEVTSNKPHFTAGELLFEIHNLLAEKYLGDHVFFEGLNYSEEGAATDLPKYELRLGS